MSSSVKLAVMDAVARYGERARTVLQAALRVAQRYRALGKKVPGDFDYRGVVEELRRSGLSYNPSNLLRILEREYGILETVYHTTNQRWYRFRDMDAVAAALSEEGEEEDDPELEMLRIQVASLELGEVRELLRRLVMKPRLSRVDRARFRRFAFRTLPRIVKLLRRAMYYEEELAGEIEALREVIALAREVAARLRGGAGTLQPLSRAEHEEALLEGKA